ncbi:PTGIR [Branchiostoma lanceolatum]|uniref:PTGIR protein n=2 Tax=Branchiostoma lanceolatum TaxID=7740 RepID=A0A8J9YY45_BRALA|nr:PTGIR [Branchiostoma lanceolatum]
MNVNCTNETEHVVHPGKAGSAIFLSSFTSLSNAAVIAIIGTRIGKNNNVPLILVLALACTDVGTALFDFLPATIAYFVGFCKTGGRPMCFFHGFAHTFLLTSSHCIVVLMALERFVALCYPFKYNKIVTNKNVTLVLLGCCVYAIIFAMLPLLGFNRVVAHFGAACFYDWYDRSTLGSIYIYWYCIQGLLLIATLVFCNMVVVRELRKMQKRMPNAAGAAKDPSLTKHREFTAYMVVASIIFTVCMTPLTIRTLCNHLGVLQSPKMDYLTVRMNITNSVINPHLFWMFRASARQRIWELIKRIACCCRRSEGEKMQLFNLSSSVGSASRPNNTNSASANKARVYKLECDGPNNTNSASADTNKASVYQPESEGPQTA